MSEALIVHKQLYHVFIKWIEEPIEVSWENGEALWRVWWDKDCPPCLKINWGWYNRFEISRVVPYEEHISPQRAEALAEHKRIQSLINQ